MGQHDKRFRLRLIAGAAAMMWLPAASAFEPFTIREIRAEGLERLDVGTVLTYLPLSVGDTGRVQEYLLRYTVEFELVDAAGAVVLARQKVELDRDYTFDTQQALGTPGEEELVKTELERDMVRTILRRIDAASRGAG